MCCACGGGRLEVPTVSPTLEPTKDPAFTPTEEPTTPPTTSQPTRSPVEGLNINYVTMGMTTAVKNQGGCGSCWAFAASEVLESAMLIAGTANAGVNLSEQELVSCSDAGSCSGGWPWESWTWIQSSTNGLAADSTFEYTATDSDCTIDPSTDGVIDAMPSEIWAATTWCYSGACDNQDEEELAENLINYGTINVNLHAGTAWGSYNGGIMTAEDCGGADATSVSFLDHAVQLVGVNSEGETAYWIVRNSWGTGWGEDGYIYIEYGTNACGIANMPALILVNGEF